jgi:hypothetical protein
MKQTALDLICIGRTGVDLHGEQAGGRLEDMDSFASYWVVARRCVYVWLAAGLVTGRRLVDELFLF